MSFECEICAKKRLVGNKISHSNIKTKRTQRPNLVRVHAIIDGTRRHLRVCTRCLRSGLVVKAP
ncbi:MAG: 50S ribosomal protein L28 [Pseudomonadota bacterium]